jgi:RimJ/RimL family protein N-acetyltransferase
VILFTTEEADVYEIGYSLLPTARGKGLVTQAARAMIKGYVVGVLGAKTLQAVSGALSMSDLHGPWFLRLRHSIMLTCLMQDVKEGNTASVKVLERLGFRYSHTVDKEENPGCDVGVLRYVLDLQNYEK